MAEAIRGGGNFKFAVMTSAGGVVEMELMIGKRLAWLVGKGTTIVPLNGAGQFEAGGFQMALHAYFHLTFGTEMRWIYDGAFHFGYR